MSEPLSSSNADGSSYAVHDSRTPSLSSGGEGSPESPSRHSWEMNYQEAAIYLQVSVRTCSGHLLAEQGGGHSVPSHRLCLALVAAPLLPERFSYEDGGSQPDGACTGKAVHGLSVALPAPGVPESVHSAFPAPLPLLRATRSQLLRGNFSLNT